MYVDANYRKNWEDSIRSFNSQHNSDSKYNQSGYDKRSKVFRPKIRTIIRKNEAAAAAAFFSNMDVVSVSANDQNDKKEVAGAEIMKHLLQYRLTKSIPWFQVLLGGIQDAQTVGVACAHVYWDYKEDASQQVPIAQADKTAENPEFPAQSSLPVGAMMAGPDGGLQETLPAQPPVAVQPPVMGPKVICDKPVVDLFPVENLRIDPGANWIDPINSSPYIIHLIPMYVLDVKSKMASGAWRKMEDAVISSAGDSTSDSTRSARQKDRDDPNSPDARSVADYEIVWVQRHIHRNNDEDWEFYTLGDIALLTTPAKLSETVFHGQRPYVMGCCILETHKVFPSSLPALGKGLQDETNEIANQRIDNIKFVLNKKWFVKRGKEADIAGLVRNVPGGVVMLDDPQADVREVTWPDVTASSFQEAQSLGSEMDELLGNFNPANIMMAGGASNPARNMALLGQSQATQVEYLLRTYVETFVQPVLRQLVLLEQYYETDAAVMKLAGKKAAAFDRFGVNEVTDELLQQEMTLTVNVGMGATDPTMKLNKFLTAMHSYTDMLKNPAPGVDMKEVGKEIFGNLGYSDGTRFFSSEDPQLLQAQQELQKAQAMIQQLNQKIQEKQTDHQVKLAATKMTNDSRLQAIASTNQNKTQLKAISEDGLNKRALATHWRALHEKSHEADVLMKTQQRQMVLGQRVNE
jgi:hypothetical protein